MIISSLFFKRTMPSGLLRAVDASFAIAFEPAPETPMLGVPNSLR